ncbi:MAG TPA: hypothetical protein VGN12_05295 [Pirellulales bacterium]|jgi:hypothetical protein
MRAALPRELGAAPSAALMSTNEHEARHSIEQMCAFEGHPKPERWPVSDVGLVFLLADGLGYAFDLADCDYAAKHKWARPQATSEGRRWDASAVAAIRNHLEFFRRWQPMSRHAAKFSHWERQQQLAELAGENLFSGLDEVTYEELLVNLVGQYDPQMRLGIMLAIKKKLGAAFYQA